MKCHASSLVLALLVISSVAVLKAKSLRNTHIKRLSRAKRNADGRPVWGSDRPVWGSDHPVWGSDRPVWGSANQNIPETTEVKPAFTAGNVKFYAPAKIDRPNWDLLEKMPTTTKTQDTLTTLPALSTTRKHYTKFDESGKPVWGSPQEITEPRKEPTTTKTEMTTTTTTTTTTKKPYIPTTTKTQETLTILPILSTTRKHYTQFDESGNPVWGKAQEITEPRNEPTTTKTEMTTTTTTTTTTKKPDYEHFDNKGRPIWHSTENTPNPWDIPSLKDYKKSIATTPKNQDYDPLRIAKELKQILNSQGNNSTTSDKQIGDLEPDPEDPCNKEAPPKKTGFSAPGKRKAIEKCEEYVEEERHRLAKAKIQQECIAYHIAHNITDVGVINGLPTIQGDYPHMAAIGYMTDRHIDIECGGTLISPQFVLTAAHCTSNIQGIVPAIVRFGDKNARDDIPKNDNRIDVPISRIIKHKNHNGVTKYNDIALLQLEREVHFNEDVRPACLWHQFEHSARTANITGWGKTESYTSKTRSSELLQAELDLVDSRTCYENLKFHIGRQIPYGLKNSQMCAGKPDGSVDACGGDSGGPLQVLAEEEIRTYYVIGVSSFGISCAGQNVPGIYTRVSAYLDWIESCVWDNIDSPNCKKYAKEIEKPVTVFNGIPSV